MKEKVLIKIGTRVSAVGGRPLAQYMTSLWTVAARCEAASRSVLGFGTSGAIIKKHFSVYK